MADLVPGTRGAEKPRVFLWEAAAAAVRVVGNADAPWFVAKDVCAALDIERTDSALRGLEDDEKGAHTVSTLGGPQEVSTVNESGLYALIFRSRKEQARVFRKWVTSEVLPQIRKTGAYAVPVPAAEPRPICITQIYTLPEPAKNSEQMVVTLIMEVLSATTSVSRRHCIVSGSTITDIARKDGSFAEWFGPHRGFQANARFFKNLANYFDRPLHRLRDPIFPSEDRPVIYAYYIHPEGRNRHRRYVLSVVDAELPRGRVSIEPAAEACAIVERALRTGGEVVVK